MKLRFWLKLIAAFVMRFKAVMVASLFFGVIIFLVLNTLIPRTLNTSTEHIGIAGRFTLDQLPKEVVANIGEGLTVLNEDGTVGLALAKDIQSSDEGKTWIVRLKEGVVWHDDSTVVSEDINYNFAEVSIERPNDSTIIYKLESPFSPFPSILSRPIFKQGLLGTGEWKVDALSLNASFIERLEIKNKNGDKKIYKFFPTEETAKTAFKLGSVDKLIDVINPDPFLSWKNIIVDERTTKERYVAIFFNNQDPTLSGQDKKSLRQGLAYSLQKQGVGIERAISPISPNSWAFNPQVKDYAYDLNRAKDLLGEPGDDPIEFKLLTTPALLSLAESVAKDWKEVGVNATVQTTAGIPSEFQAFLAIYNIPSDPDQYSTWHTTQIGTNNIARYSNPRISKLLEDGRLELDQERRKKIYFDFQRFLLEDSPAIFLHHPVSYTISRN